MDIPRPVLETLSSGNSFTATLPHDPQLTRRDRTGVDRISQLMRIAVAWPPCLGGFAARSPRNVADHQRELEIHLEQGFLHALDETARAPNEGGAAAEIPRKATMLSAGRKLPRRRSRISKTGIQ